MPPPACVTWGASRQSSQPGRPWQALPSDGLPIAKSGNEVDYTVTSALSATTWYRRVRAGTGT